MAMETCTKRKRHLKWDVTNYKDLLSAHCLVKQGGIVKMRLKSRKEELYPVEIVERTEDKCVKVHYVGYEDMFDEWKDEDDLEELFQPVRLLQPRNPKCR